MLIVNPDDMGFLEKIVPRAETTAKGGTGGEMGLQPQAGDPFAVEIKAFLSPLGFPCQATPISYVSNKAGRQCVVVMAGGHGSLGVKMSDTLVMYALPEGTAVAKK
ncbi:hypothetical protein [Janthinobacterium sp. LB3P112]|uniref:hypothetical protein n=1 Tax=Janthinobacterium sp. LB3P112 TaxID=3424196 RepID=UPI003F281C1B